MMHKRVFGSLRFDGVAGVIIPNTARTVRIVENPAQIPAALDLRLLQESTLTYDGFFASSPKSTVYGMPGPTPIIAEDETGERRSVLVQGIVDGSYKSRRVLNEATGLVGRVVSFSVRLLDWTV